MQLLKILNSQLIKRSPAYPLGVSIHSRKDVYTFMKESTYPGFELEPMLYILLLDEDRKAVGYSNLWRVFDKDKDLGEERFIGPRELLPALTMSRANKFYIVSNYVGETAINGDFSTWLMILSELVLDCGVSLLEALRLQKLHQYYLAPHTRE